jgi:acyl carrier protein
MSDQANTNMAAIGSFIDNFQSAVDFQERVEITAETELASLAEWDSLAALGVIVMFDMEYGKTITGNDLKTCKTIADLFALLG